MLMIVSYLAPNWFPFYQAVADYLGDVLQVDTLLIQGQDDPLRDVWLLQDRLDLAFMCGLPFSRYHQQMPEQVQALVAPVMRFPRYQQQPIYFADIIVRSDSEIATLADLAGKTFCYNDRGSNSGYQLMRDHLFQLAYPARFFQTVIASGSHQASIRWVVEGKADCAAIDSTVLERENHLTPALIDQLRVIETIGPCPMPPLIAAQHLGADRIHQVRSALLEPNQVLQSTMQQMDVERFSAVQTSDYTVLAHRYHQILQSDWIQQSNLL